jgi:hypothetical protein
MSRKTIRFGSVQSNKNAGNKNKPQKFLCPTPHKGKMQSFFLELRTNTLTKQSDTSKLMWRGWNPVMEILLLLLLKKGYGTSKPC